ncbi:MAG: sulfatase-like hydrolase/transferase [Bacteroidales bacterium]|nr:sulfatase-like hydrolase/transferase [Bacteroidales bacterium]
MKNINRRGFLKTAIAGGGSLLASKGLQASPNEKEFIVPDVYLTKKRSRPLNVVWITCDEMNSRAMSIYGNPHTHMPAAEQMSREGITFEAAYVQMPKSVPSRVSMITGRYPHCEGHRTLAGKLYSTPFDGVKNDLFTIEEDEFNLIPIVRKMGYKTCLLGKNHLVDWSLHKKWFDLTQDWSYEKNYIPAEPVGDDWERAHFTGKLASSYNMENDKDAVAARQACGFIRENKERPFFALIDIERPHPKYIEFTDMPSYSIPLKDIDNPTVIALDKAPSVEQAKRRSFDLEHFTDEDRKRVRRAYYSMCEYADSMVKRIIDEVDRLGLGEDTLIIYNADHGDFNGERNMYEKWDTSFYEEIVRVPLLMRLKGTLPAGKRIPNLVELVDIAPTILELMGYEKPIWMQGKSLLNLARGNTTEHKDAVFSQGGVEREALNRPEPYMINGKLSAKQRVVYDFPESMIKSRMIRMGNFKYIYRLAGDNELYDLSKDPHETENLAANPNYRDVVTRLQERLLRFMMEYETDYPVINQLQC